MIIIRHFGKEPYIRTWEKMQEFTKTRSETTPDECWILEHPPVYTQGIAGKAEHLLKPSSIPLVQSDRGGQITYHGPGQIICYFLINLKRRNIGIRSLVTLIETIIIQLLANYDISASRICKAPGVYVNAKKIASLGLRVKNGCSYHGSALNVAMDLSPFSSINPCGFEKLEMVQISDFIPGISLDEVSAKLEAIIKQIFERNHVITV